MRVKSLLGKYVLCWIYSSCDSLRHPSVPPSALVLPTWSSHTFKSTTKPEGPEPAPDYYEIYPSGSGPALCLQMSGKTRSRGVIGLPQPQLQQILSESLAGWAHRNFFYKFYQFYRPFPQTRFFPLIQPFISHISIPKIRPVFLLTTVNPLIPFRPSFPLASTFQPVTTWMILRAVASWCWCPVQSAIYYMLPLWLSPSNCPHWHLLTHTCQWCFRISPWSSSFSPPLLASNGDTGSIAQPFHMSSEEDLSSGPGRTILNPNVQALFSLVNTFVPSSKTSPSAFSTILSNP